VFWNIFVLLVWTDCVTVVLISDNGTTPSPVSYSDASIIISLTTRLAKTIRSHKAEIV